MKAIFISCNQALYDEVHQEMKRLGVHGFTGWEEVTGRGMYGGEPHLGDYAWPSLNSAMIVMVDEPKAGEFIEALRRIDKANEQLGLRAFWWDVEGTI